MNPFSGSLLAFFIALGYKHNPVWKKSMHAFLCIALFSTCHRLIWVGQISLPLYITLAYICLMAIWTLYARYPLYRTYAKILGGIGHSKFRETTQLSERFTLKPYTSAWREQFLAEHERTRSILMSKWKHILHEELTPHGLVHIGSTSIKDIALAKPQHDCALAVTCHSLPRQFFNDLASLGYVYIGVAPHSLDCGDHFFYRLPAPEDRGRYGEGFFLHVVTPKVHEWLRTSLAFCEYLSHNTVARKSYSDLKRNISAPGTKIGTYTMKKYDLVMQLRQEAKIWMKTRKELD